MDISRLRRISKDQWELPASGDMRVPVVFYADQPLLEGMDEKVREQATNVATLPGIVKASCVMPDGHWGYGFPIGGVGAFDPAEGGVVSAGGVGFDISCGVRCLLTGLQADEVEPIKNDLAEALFARIPAGVGSTGRIHLDDEEMVAMLRDGARWAVSRGWGSREDLARIEEQGSMQGAEPEYVSHKARHRQRNEMGTLGSGNHYLEVQRVAEIFRPEVASSLSLGVDDVVVSVHCGSRGLGHQIGTEFLREMAISAADHGIVLPDRELACAPLRSEVGQRYLGAMRAGINCALANRQIITHLTREVFSDVLPRAELPLLYDVSHNTCKEEQHVVDGVTRRLFIHRKGATRAFGPDHPELPESLRDLGQPVLIGGSMGTESWVLIGTREGMTLSFGSACHGAGRRMSRHRAKKQWRGSKVVNNLAHRGIIVRSASMRGVAEEAPGAYKDVRRVVDSADRAGLAHKVARLEPMVCIKG